MRDALKLPVSATIFLFTAFYISFVAIRSARISQQDSPRYNTSPLARGERAGRAVRRDLLTLLTQTLVADHPGDEPGVSRAAAGALAVVSLISLSRSSVVGVGNPSIWLIISAMPWDRR